MEADTSASPAASVKVFVAIPWALVVTAPRLPKDPPVVVKRNGKPEIGVPDRPVTLAVIVAVAAPSVAFVNGPAVTTTPDAMLTAAAITVNVLRWGTSP